MNPIKINGANRELQPPPDWNEEVDGPCGSLHVIADIPPGGGLRMTSAWMPDADELAALNKGHPVLLTVYGRALPPMALAVSAEPNECVHVFVRTLADRVRTCALCGWEEAARDIALAPAAEAVDADMVERVLHSPVPGGSQVWWSINGGGMSVDNGHRIAAKRVIEAYIAIYTTPQPAPVVDEEMIARGVAAIAPPVMLGENTYRSVVETVLKAALAPKPTSDAGEG